MKELEEELFARAQNVNPTQTPQTAPDADSFLMGESIPALKFDDVGTAHQGVILSKRVAQQTDFYTGKPKVYEDGKPANQLIVVLMTDKKENILGKNGQIIRTAAQDDGKRSLYIKTQMKAAVREAVKDAGAQGLDVGGTLAVKLDSLKSLEKGRDQKIYTAKYKPAPTNNAELD